MSERSDTLVFVPAWNEERSLPAVLDELRRDLPDADVLVVDDGSTDRTAAIASEHGADVLSFPENRGLRAAIAAGYDRAAAGGYAYCGRVDADGQHPVAELRRLLELVRSDECDVAVGSRFASGEGFEADRYEPTAPRKLGTTLLRNSMEVVLGRPFHDATSGMHAANARALPILARPYQSGAPEVEAVLRLHDEGMRVNEVPVHMRERAGGESKLRGKKAVVLVATVIGTLVAALLVRRRRARGSG
jgi:glycosyltransferase involved in cell wall biosynthesis